MKKNIVSGCLEIPVKCDTKEKIIEYCKKKGIVFNFERWVFKSKK